MKIPISDRPKFCSLLPLSSDDVDAKVAAERGMRMDTLSDSLGVWDRSLSCLTGLSFFDLVYEHCRMHGGLYGFTTNTIPVK